MVLIQCLFQFRAGQRTHFFLQLPDLAVQIDHIFFDGQKFFVNAQIGMIPLLLGKIADGCVFAMDHFSLICVIFTHDNAEHCGFPGTVNANHSHSFSLVNMKRGILENGCLSKRFKNMITC